MERQTDRQTKGERDLLRYNTMTKHREWIRKRRLFVLFRMVSGLSAVMRHVMVKVSAVYIRHGESVGSVHHVQWKCQWCTSGTMKVSAVHIKYGESVGSVHHVRWKCRQCTSRTVNVSAVYIRYGESVGSVHKVRAVKVSAVYITYGGGRSKDITDF